MDDLPPRPLATVQKGSKIAWGDRSQPCKVERLLTDPFFLHAGAPLPKRARRRVLGPDYRTYSVDYGVDVSGPAGGQYRLGAVTATETVTHPDVEKLQRTVESHYYVQRFSGDGPSVGEKGTNCAQRVEIIEIHNLSPHSEQAEIGSFSESCS